MSGTMVLQPGAAVAPGDIAVAVSWIITEELISAARRTSEVEMRGAGEGAVTLDVHELPPPEALVANEATLRDGVAVGYVVAYVDANGTDSLDCLSATSCADYLVGGSRNALVVYAAEAWPETAEPLLTFGCAAGARPAAGWSLVHLDPPNCSGRPTVRDWAGGDALDLVVLGKERAASLSVTPDVD